MMQTDCLSQDFILKETKRGALQNENENENECESLLRSCYGGQRKKESNNVRFRNNKSK